MSAIVIITAITERIDVRKCLERRIGYVKVVVAPRVVVISYHNFAVVVKYPDNISLYVFSVEICLSGILKPDYARIIVEKL